MPSACDACGATGVPLAKVSLGRDFFGRGYDRLTPASDRSPAWYCPRCSEEKRMQLDHRAIGEAVRDLGRGGDSPLADRAQRERAAARLEAIATALRDGDFVGKLLAAGDVEALAAELARAAPSAP